MQSLVLIFLLYSSAVYGVGTAAQEAAYNKEQTDKAQQRAERNLEAAIIDLDFPNIVNNLAIVQGEQERSGAIEFVVHAFKPDELKSKYEQKFKQFETAILSYQKQFGHLPKIFNDPSVIKRWSPFLPHVKLVIPLDIDLPPIEAPKDVKVAQGPQRTVLFFVRGKNDPTTKRVLRIPRGLVTDHKIAGRIATTLEDHDVSEVELKGDFKVLEELVRGFQAVKKVGLDEDARYEDYTAMRKRGVLGVIGSVYTPAREMLADLLKAAAYENSPFLIDFYAQEYAKRLHENPAQIAHQLQQDNFPQAQLQLIDTYYFLLFDEGIDRQFRRIPLDMLVAYDKLPANIDINKPGIDGNSPLIEAIEKRDYPEALSLIRAGADVNAIDDAFTTVWGYAAQMNNPALLAALSDAGARPIINVLDDEMAHNQLDRVLTAIESDSKLGSRTPYNMLVVGIMRNADPAQLDAATIQRVVHQIERFNKKDSRVRRLMKDEAHLMQKWQPQFPELIPIISKKK